MQKMRGENNFQAFITRTLVNPYTFTPLKAEKERAIDFGALLQVHAGLWVKEPASQSGTIKSSLVCTKDDAILVHTPVSFNTFQVEPDRLAVLAFVIQPDEHPICKDFDAEDLAKEGILVRLKFQHHLSSEKSAESMTRFGKFKVVEIDESQENKLAALTAIFERRVKYLVDHPMTIQVEMD